MKQSHLFHSFMPHILGMFTLGHIMSEVLYINVHQNDIGFLLEADALPPPHT